MTNSFPGNDARMAAPFATRYIKENSLKRIAFFCLAALSVTSASAQSSGFLCCNMRTDGSWISDINYADSGKTMLPAGTPLSMDGYGKHRILVTINGRRQAIGNDYSRGMSLDAVAKRYIVEQDPLLRLKTYPKHIQEAIGSARLVRGMNREQVLMAVGYPVYDENPSLESNTWRYWLSSFEEFDAIFDDKGVLTAIQAEPEVRRKVVAAE